jgi:hypothetical protein
MYVVIQKGYAIYGAAKTKEKAVIDAKQWICRTSKAQDWEVEDFPIFYNSTEEGQLVLLEATELLVKKVQDEGGSIPYEVTNNIANLS